MKPSKILLIRHAESESNRDLAIHAIKPDFKIELTDLGKIQAMEAGVKIKEILESSTPDTRNMGYIDPAHLQTFPEVAVYNSPFYRTRQTAALIKQSIKDYIVREYEDPRLREQEYGHLRGREEAEQIDRERDAYSRFYFRIPDGESGADVLDRQAGFLETLYRDFADDDYPDNVLIVGHGFQIRTLLMKWLHWTVEEFESKRNVNNCEILQLILNENGKYELLNDPLNEE
jgi:broad specificity phosphatase PhoE